MSLLQRRDMSVEPLSLRVQQDAMQRSFSHSPRLLSSPYSLQQPQNIPSDADPILDEYHSPYLTQGFEDATSSASSPPTTSPISPTQHQSMPVSPDVAANHFDYYARRVPPNASRRSSAPDYHLNMYQRPGPSPPSPQTAYNYPPTNYPNNYSRIPDAGGWPNQLHQNLSEYRIGGQVQVTPYNEYPAYQSSYGATRPYENMPAPVSARVPPPQGMRRSSAPYETRKMSIADLGAGSRVSMATPFINKLVTLLNSPEYHSVIRWGDKGDVILFSHLDPKLLQVFSTVFRHSNTQSFIRQLNIYGFHRIAYRSVKETESWASEHAPGALSGFVHPRFFRNTPTNPCDYSQLKPRIASKQQRGRAELERRRSSAMSVTYSEGSVSDGTDSGYGGGDASSYYGEP